VNVRDNKAAIPMYLAPEKFLDRARGNTQINVVRMHCMTLNIVGNPLVESPPLTGPVISILIPNFIKTNVNSYVLTMVQARHVANI
jgi:hypothetical protein